MGVLPGEKSAGGMPFLLKERRFSYAAAHSRQPDSRPGARPAGDSRAWLDAPRGRHDPRPVAGKARAVCRPPRDRLRQRARDAVVRGHAPARAAVSHARHGDGSAAARLAQHLHLQNRGALCRHGLCPPRLPAARRRPHHKRHDARVHVLVTAHRGDVDSYGGA